MVLGDEDSVEVVKRISEIEKRGRYVTERKQAEV
jgi:tRNA A-37 threonylcarbamoyl transferase component Bud32